MCIFSGCGSLPHGSKRGRLKSKGNSGSSLNTFLFFFLVLTIPLLTQFKWRNGWFYSLSEKAIAAGKPDPCPLHTAWLAELKVI